MNKVKMKNKKLKYSTKTEERKGERIKRREKKRKIIK